MLRYSVGCGAVMLVCALLLFSNSPPSPPGIPVSQDQAARVLGGQTVTHTYNVYGSEGYCTGSTYPRCGAQNSCISSTTFSLLANEGKKCYATGQPCSIKLCEGAPVSCGSMTKTACS